MLHVCGDCEPPAGRRGPLLCHSCWHLQQQPCRACGEPKGHKAVSFFKYCCGACHTRFFCDRCNAPCPKVDFRQCRRCAQRPAAWCAECYSVDELARGVCHSCSSAVASCAYCFGLCDGVSVSWLSCATTGCDREVRVCETCAASHKDCATGHPRAVRCIPCWKAQGSKCIACGVTVAQTERIYKHRCRPCFADAKDHAVYRMLREETEAFLSSQCSMPEQQWDGTEPALQLLLLPERAEDRVSADVPAESFSSKRLPAYAPRPLALDPRHCRLCFQGLSPRLWANLTLAAGMTPTAGHPTR